jgi:hypothetical protein
MTITREIYDKMIETARFLKYNEKDNAWEELSPTAARDKVSKIPFCWIILYQLEE